MAVATKTRPTQTLPEDINPQTTPLPQTTPPAQTGQSARPYWQSGYVVYWVIFGVAAFAAVGYVLQLGMGLIYGLLVTVAFCTLAGIFPISYLAYSRANDVTCVMYVHLRLAAHAESRLVCGNKTVPTKVSQ
jgi:hypothetical protein